MVAAEVGLDPVEASMEQLNDAIGQGLSTGKMFNDRGIYRIRAGKFDEAGQDLDKAIQLDPSSHWTWYRRGCLEAYLGHTQAYRTNCSEMFERFADSSDWAIRDRTIKTCLVQPSPVDPKRLMELADVNLAQAIRTAKDVAFAQLTHAMACHRSGNDARCLESVQACASSENADMPDRSAAAEALIAMAQERLAHHEQALAAAQRADMIDQLPVAGRDDMRGNPENWLICRVLLREAEGIIHVATQSVALTQNRPVASWRRAKQRERREKGYRAGSQYAIQTACR